ncbi:MAG: UDP-glucose/GDP-mannose dehydrogenase family protein [Oceanospirillales bacterium]|nr:MAG: UDP-glucose/GDP-mannose dehydrogenase family protein [Oceanospirillales bacterium]
MRLAIWGNELIAWTAAAAFAEYGNKVHMNQLFSDQKSFSDQAEGSSFLYNEPGLLAQVKRQYDQENLIFGQPEQALLCPVHILALSPDQLELGKQIISYLSKHAPDAQVIINYSTFGLGASEALSSLLNQQQHLVYIPDSLSEGQAYANFTQPQTLIIGSKDKRQHERVQALYKPFSNQLNQLLLVELREAEFIKFAVNGMLAMRLGYINELANLADSFEIDIDTIVTGMGSDPRIGKHYLSPGCGFGGAHFSQTIEHMAGLLKANRNSIILDTLLLENNKQKTRPFRKLWQHYKTDVVGKKVAVWGLAFKPNTASIQNAPSLSVVEALLAQGCQVQAHDPKALINFSQHFPADGRISYYEDPIDAVKNADALILLTEWNEYWSPDFDLILEKMNTPLIIDGRNIFDKDYLASLGFIYYGMGR